MKLFKKIWRWITATRLRKLLSLTLAILILLTSIKYIFLYPKTVSASSLIVTTSLISATRTSNTRRVVRTTNGPMGHRVFATVYDGTTEVLYYSDDSEAPTPVWTSAGTFGTGFVLADMVWDETNNVLYIAYGRFDPSNNSNSDIYYRRVTDLGGAATLGAERSALDGTSGGTIYNFPQVEIAQDSGTTKVFVFGNRGVSGSTSPSGWDVSVGTINSDNPTWGTFNAKTYTAAAGSSLLGVARVNTNKLVVMYYDGTQILATRHNDADDAEASSGWDALDGTDNNTTQISTDDPDTKGEGTIVGMPTTDAVWFAWQEITTDDINTRRWNGSSLDAEDETLDTSNSDSATPTLTTDGITLWLLYRNNSSDFIYRTRDATDGTSAWGAETIIILSGGDNTGYPSTAKKIYQGKLDAVYTGQTSLQARHLSLTVSADALLAFDEGYGTTTNDRVGNISAGTITNAVWKTPEYCVRDNCLYYDGSGDKVAFADDSDLDFLETNNFTLLGWFRTPDITTGTRVLLAKHNATAGGYKVYMDSSGYVVFGIDDDSTWTPDNTASTSTTAFDDNKWHQFAAVKTGTTDIKIYVDGILYQTTAVTATNTLANADSFYVGIDGDGSGNGFSGFIDEVKVYRSARTSTEIKADYNAETPRGGVATYFGPDQKYLSNGLVGYWRMEEASDATRLDSSGNGNTLTESASDTVVQSPGKFGYGGDFELADTEYISVADSVSLSITGSLTLSAWVKPETVTGGTYNIISKWDGTNESYRLMQNGDEIRIEIDTNGNYVETTASNLAAATWYHVVGTYDSVNQKARVFVNGTEATSTITGTIPSSIGDDAGVFHIGAEDSTGGATGYYDGVIDEARVYSRAFSPAEVGQLYSWSAGPIGWWKLDDNTGTSAFDSSGLDNTGTLTNTPIWTQGKFGSAVSFAGSNQHIIRADDSDFDFSTAQSFSYGAWIKHGAASALEMIIDKYDATAGNGGFKLYMESDGDLTCGIDDDETSFPEDAATSTAATYDDGLWHHIMCIKDGTAGLYLYIDGVLIASDVTISSTGDFANADPLYIGIAEDGTSNDWVGQIDDARIYNYARTQSQLLEDMNAGHPAPGSPVGSSVAYWKMDEGYGTTAHDTSVNANDLTLSASAWTNSGKFGKAWNGDGTNPHLSRADDPDFDFVSSTDFTLSTWVKSDSASNPAASEYLIDKQVATDAPGYSLRFNTSGQLVCEIDDDSTSFPEDAATGTTDYYDNVWHSVVCIRDITQDKLFLYVDGSSHAQDTDLSATGDLSNADSLTIGARDTTAGGTDDFAGDMDEIKIFRSALSSDQIKVLYNQSANTSFGALSTDSTGAASNSDTNSYCPPGQGSTCTAPVGDWNLDENTGTSAQDASSNDNTLTLTNSPTYTAGKFGTGVNFNASNAQLTRADDADFDFGAGGSFTLETWFKHDTASAQQLIMSKFNEAGYKLIMESDGDITCGIDYDSTWTPADFVTSTAATYDDNSWHYIQCVKNANTSLTLFIDGVPVGTQDTTLTNSTLANSDPIYIGIDADGTSNDLVGSVDGIKIYSVARTQAQLTWDYNRGAPIGWWKMDECTLTTIHDSSLLGSGSAGAKDGTWSGATGTNTASGGCTAVDTATAWYNGRTGKYNASLDFDATDDVVSVTNTSQIDLNEGLLNGFTFSAWIYPNGAGESNGGRIFDKSLNDGTTTNTVKCQLQAVSGGFAPFVCGLDLTGSDGDTSATQQVPIDQWSHVAFSWTNDADDEVTVWVNGISTTSSGGYSGDPSADTYSLFIGGNGTAANNIRAFDGKIDDFRIYNYEATTQQIRTIINQGAAVRY